MSQSISNPYYDYLMAINGGGASPDIGEVYEGVHFQRGYGIAELMEMQQGSGIGDSLASIVRFAMPLLRSGLKYLGNTAVSTAADIAKDAIAGENIKSAAKKRVENSATEMFGKMPGAIRDVMDKTEGRKRKLVISSPAVETSTTPLKRKRFGLPTLGKKFHPSKGAARLLSKFPALKRID